MGNSDLRLSDFIPLKGVGNYLDRYTKARVDAFIADTRITPKLAQIGKGNNEEKCNDDYSLKYTLLALYNVAIVSGVLAAAYTGIEKLVK